MQGISQLITAIPRWKQKKNPAIHNMVLISISRVKLVYFSVKENSVLKKPSNIQYEFISYRKRVCDI